MLLSSRGRELFYSPSQETMRAVSPVRKPPPLFFCSGFIFWPPSSADSLLVTSDTETRIPQSWSLQRALSSSSCIHLSDTNRVRTAVCHLVSTVTCNGVRVNPRRPCLCSSEGLWLTPLSNTRLLCEYKAAAVCGLGGSLSRPEWFSLWFFWLILWLWAEIITWYDHKYHVTPPELAADYLSEN